MKRLLLIFVTFFIVSGCTNSDEILSIENTQSVYVGNVEPREVSIIIKDAAFSAYPDRFCWNKDIKVCKKMEPRHPKDVEVKHNLPIGRVEIGEVVKIQYDFSNYSTLPKGNHFELMLYQGDEIIPIEVKEESFIVPDIKGMQYYVYKVTSDKEYKGIAYHTFVLNAQE